MDGYIESVLRDGIGRVYLITERGREELRNSRSQLDQLYRRLHSRGDASKPHKADKADKADKAEPGAAHCRSGAWRGTRTRFCVAATIPARRGAPAASRMC